jgi:hypothetical protein
MSEIDISMLEHLTAGQIKELLGLAATDVRVTPNWLIEIGDWEQMRYLLDAMCAGIGQSGLAVLEAVCCLETSVDALIAIKSIAKRLAASAGSAPEKAAATLLYHLSIASALGNHRLNISSKDPAERLSLYKELAAELSDEDLALIFEKAVAKASAAKL